PMDERLVALWSRGRALWACLAGATATVRVDPAVRYQTVEGWGTSLAWWGHVVGGWPDATRNAIADLVFSSTSGLGLNVVRYNVGGAIIPRTDTCVRVAMCPASNKGQVQPFALIAQRRKLFNLRAVNICQPLESDDALPFVSVHHGASSG